MELEQVKRLAPDFKVSVTQIGDDNDISMRIAISPELAEFLKFFACLETDTTELYVDSWGTNRYRIKKILGSELMDDDANMVLFSKDLIDNKQIDIPLESISKGEHIIDRLKPSIKKAVEVIKQLKKLQTEITFEVN